MANEIKFDKNNYRIHSAENKSLIQKSLEDCGAGRSILLDKENEIIAGNGVYEQAKKLNIPVKVVETDGKELIVVKRTDLKTSDQKRKQLAVMDNTTSDSSEFDIEKLEADFGAGELGDFGIEGIDIQIENTNESEPEDARSEGKTERYTEDSDDIPSAPEYGTGDNQRIIICYKRNDKEKLEKLLGIDISKILYTLKDLRKAREEKANGDNE